MAPESDFDEIVAFEVPLGAELLCDRLHATRHAWLQLAEGAPRVVVPLAPAPDDLAELLRTVQGFAAERCLVVRFRLDGREYRLDPGRSALPPRV